MRCEQFCFRPLVTCLPDESALEAACLMARENIGFLPICDGDDCLLGVLTDRDLIVRVLAPGLPADETTVRAVMSPDVVTCREDDDLGTAELLMAQHQVERVVVVDREGRCVGVVSLSDVAASEPESRSGSVLRQVTEREARIPH